MTTIELLIVLSTGGGIWVAIREIAKQVGETKRERIRQQGETARLTIVHALPLPARGSKKPE